MARKKLPEGMVKQNVMIRLSPSDRTLIKERKINVSRLVEAHCALLRKSMKLD